MLIVIPVSFSDAIRLPWLVDVMLYLQGLQAHEILIFSTPNVVNQANAQADRLRSACPAVNVASMEVDPVWGWPINPNLQWNACVSHLEHIGHRAGWLWMEVDCVPVKREWANLLANEYMSRGKPFCGKVVDTPFRDAQGNIQPTPSGDTMMMGCAIYPPHMPRDEIIAPLFRDVGKAPPRNAEQPWDIYLRWVMKQRGVASSELIADMWSTCKYRHEGASVVCDAAPIDEKLRGRAKGSVVPADAVMVHGCKDESLYDLVLGKSPGADVKHVASDAGVGFNFLHTVGKSKLDAITDAAPVVGVGIEGPVGTPGPDYTGPLMPLDSNGHAIPSSLTDSEETYAAILTNALTRGSLRLGDAAKLVKMDKDKLRALLPKLGFRVKGVGWIAAAAR